MLVYREATWLDSCFSSIIVKTLSISTILLKTYTYPNKSIVLFLSQFELYVKNANPLPIAEYYAKLGIKYIPKVNTGEQVSTLGLHVGFPDEKFRLMRINKKMAALGLEVNDELIAINATEVTMQNAQQILVGLQKLPIGEEYKIKVRRGDEEIDVTAKVLSQEKIKKHVFKLDEDASDDQKTLREIWLKNLQFAIRI